MSEKEKRLIKTIIALKLQLIQNETYLGNDKNRSPLGHNKRNH